LFIIPDYFLIHDATTFSQILANRLVMSFMAALLYKVIGTIENRAVLCGLITFYEAIIALSFCVIFGQYENPDFLIQTFGLIIIVLIVFTAPNRWIYKNIVTLCLYLVFFTISFLYLEAVAAAERSAALAYALLTILLSSWNSYSINRFKRIAYTNNKALEFLSNTDPLTGTFNRAKFNTEMEGHLHTYDEMQQIPYSLIIFDIDNFKNVNDNMGHLTGDKVIIELADMVKDNIRENDMLFRWGGEEFIVLLKDCGKDQAIMVAEKLRRIIENRRFQGSLHITCSFGVVSDNKRCSLDDILSRGDKYLYMAKEAGKNRVKAYPGRRHG
jgi:diguanylate cyclase (GGDEF)-like protein